MADQHAWHTGKECCGLKDILAKSAVNSETYGIAQNQWSRWANNMLGKMPFRPLGSDTSFFAQIQPSSSRASRLFHILNWGSMIDLKSKPYEMKCNPTEYPPLSLSKNSSQPLVWYPIPITPLFISENTDLWQASHQPGAQNHDEPKYELCLVRGREAARHWLHRNIRCPGLQRLAAAFL